MANQSRIDALKAKLVAEKEKKEKGGTNFSNDIYPFWVMATGDSARVRILPDKNEDNDYIFFVDRLEHTISLNGEDKKIPCRSMYGEDCPICELSRKYYKEEGKGSKNGKYFYRKKTSILRVLVQDDPLEPNKETGETFEGKVVNTQFGYQLMEKIKEQISNDDLGDFTDFKDGFDFIIKKTPQGDYGTYSVGSQFARKPTELDDETIAKIELIDLSTLLPKDLGYEKVHNMLQAHISGDEYEDDDKKPAKDAKPAAKPVAESAKPKPKPVVKPEPEAEAEEAEEVEEVEVEEEPAPKPVTKPKPKPEPEAEAEEPGDEDDIIAQLRARKNAAKK